MTQLRETMDTVLDRLLRIRALVRKQIELREQDPSANLSPTQMREIDEHRDWIIATMNDLWSRSKLGTLKLPTKIMNYEEVNDQSE